MGYFRELPDLAYQSFLPEKNSSQDYVIVKNLFRRVKLRDDLYNVFTIFNKYEIKDGARPDTVADEIYGSPELDWVVLITANITNVRDQWPLSDYQLYNYAENKYGNDLTKIRFYETTEVKDSSNRLILPAGKVVDSNFSFVYADSGKNYSNYSNSLSKISYTKICAENVSQDSLIIKSSVAGNNISANDELVIDGQYIPVVSVTNGTTVIGVTTSFVGVATALSNNIGITTTIITGISTNATGNIITIGQTLKEIPEIIGYGVTVTSIGIGTVYIDKPTQNTTSQNLITLSFGNNVTTVLTENTKNITLSSPIPTNISKGSTLTFKVRNTVLIETNPVIGVSNYEYEVRKNNEKRLIYLLKPEYLQQFLNDMRVEMLYSESSEYITDTLIRTENTNVTLPQ